MSKNKIKDKKVDNSVNFNLNLFYIINKIQQNIFCLLMSSSWCLLFLKKSFCRCSYLSYSLNSYIRARCLSTLSFTTVMTLVLIKASLQYYSAATAMNNLKNVWDFEWWNGRFLENDAFSLSLFNYFLQVLEYDFLLIVIDAFFQGHQSSIGF